MGRWLEALGPAAAVLSAAALYAGSPHCRWPGLRRWSRPMPIAGLALACLAAASWTLALGPAGLCAMLACWMLALVAQPWMALLSRRDPQAGSRNGSATLREVD